MLNSSSIGSALSSVLESLHDDPICYDYGIDAISQDLTTGPSHVVTIGAKTGTGKTALALQIATSMAQSKLKVAYLSLEMSAKSLAERLIARSGTMAALRHKDATPSQESAMRIAAAELRKLPLTLVEAYGCTVADVEQYIKEHPSVDVIIIDYLQLLGGKEATAYERSTNASKALTTLAHETGKTIIALAQLGLKGDAATGDPALGSIQGTTQYEQDSDAVLMIWREEEGTADSRRILRIVKNRHGPAGRNIYLDFDGNTMSFTESVDQTKKSKKGSDREWNFSKKKENPAQSE